MSRAAVLEEMYLLYQAMRYCLAEPWGECGVADIVKAVHAFRLREPAAGEFLQSVLVELLAGDEEVSPRSRSKKQGKRRY